MYLKKLQKFKITKECQNKYCKLRSKIIEMIMKLIQNKIGE